MPLKTSSYRPSRRPTVTRECAFYRQKARAADAEFAWTVDELSRIPRRPAAVHADDDWKPVYAALREFAALRDDWDGGGSRAPAIRTVARAAWAAGRLCAADRKSPTRAIVSVNGSIYFEWQGLAGRAELEITGDGISPLRSAAYPTS